MIITFKGHRWIKFGDITLSIYNGFGSYSENHFRYSIRNKKIVISKTCEIAILRNGFFITDSILNNGDDVKGHVNKKELKEIIKIIKNYGEDNEKNI